MYRILYDKKVVHDPYSPDENAFNVTCYGGINDKGNMVFSIAPTHPLYNKIKLRHGEVRFTNDDTVIFVGFIEKIETDLNLIKEVSCIGDMAHLGDVILRPYTTDFTEGLIHVEPTANDLFEWYIKCYNEKAYYPFVIGLNEVAGLSKNEQIERSNRGYSSVGEEIENQLINTIGGYISIHYDGDTRYIDYAQDLNSVNKQIIDFGVNLTDYLRTESTSEVYTVVVPTGAEDEKTGFPLTLDGYREGETVSARFYREGDSVTNTDLTAEYGYREIYYSNTDCKTQDALLEAAIAYLKKFSDPSKMIICKAVDLALFMDGYQHLRVGEIVRVRSRPHDVDQYMVVTEIEIDLDNPDNTEYTLGIVYDTLTGEQSARLTSMNSSINKSVDEVADLDQNLKETAKDAAQTRDELNGLIERFESSEFDRSEFEKQVSDTIRNLQDIADGAIETWFFPGPPQDNSLPTINWQTEDDKYIHLGDLYYDTETGYAYRWLREPNASGEMRYSWGRIIDTDVEEALRVASQAKDTADSKRRVFFETPYPPYDEGDLWAQGSGGDILVSTVDRHTGKFVQSDWVYAAKYSKAIYSSEEQFYQSNSPTKLEGGEWLSTNTWIEGKYTWRRTLVTYGNGDKEYIPSEKGICITGNTGDDGVGIANVDVEYYLSRYSDRLAGDVWHTDPPDFIEGRYMWSRTKVVYTDGRIEYTPSENGACIAVSGTEGANGVGVAYFEEQYIRTKSNTTAPATNDKAWSSAYPGWVEGEYLWTRTVVHYTDGSTSMTDPICVSGIQGEKGDKGTGVANVDVWYYLSRSSTELIGSTWVTVPPQWVEGRFMWTKTIVYYTDGTSEETKPVCIAVSGKEGTDGVGVAYLEEQYFQSASNTQAPGDKESGWTSVYPGISTAKPYIWTRTVVHYNDGSLSMTDPICVTGPKGQDGKGIKSIVQHYLATNLATGVGINTAGWTETVQNPTADKKYLWNYETINYTEGNATNTTPAIIGTFGVDGVSISSVTEYYLATNLSSGVTRDTPGWKTTMATTNATNKYLWNYEVINYSNGKDTKTDPALIGVYSVDGTNGTNGKGISSIIEYYLATSAKSGVTTKTSGWQTTVQTMTASNKYLWNYERVNYTDGTYTETEPVIIGAYGDKGEDGVGVLGVDVEYYLSTSSTTLAGGQWQTTSPTWQAGKFMWTRTRVRYSNGNTVYTPSENGVCIALNGSNGVGVKSMVEEYAQSTSSTQAPSDGWSTTYPGWKNGYYIWTRTVITYTDGNQITTTMICVTGSPGKDGTNGTNGKDGKGISKTEITYQTSTSGTVAPTGTWSTTIPSIPTGYYLWTRTIITYTDNTTTTSYSVSRSGVDGTNGTNGKDGTNGTTLSGTSPTAASTAAKLATVSGFSLYDGVCVSILFTYGNTADSPTLNVNSTGAFAIRTNGLNSAYWQDNEAVLFVYSKGANANSSYWNVASSPVWANEVTVGNPTKENVYINSDTINLRTGSGTSAIINSSFSKDSVSIGKNSPETFVGMCADRFRLIGTIDDSGTIYIGQLSVRDGEKDGSDLQLASFCSEGTGSSMGLSSYTPTNKAKHIHDAVISLGGGGGTPFKSVRQNSTTTTTLKGTYTTLEGSQEATISGSYVNIYGAIYMSGAYSGDTFGAATLSLKSSSNGRTAISVNTTDAPNGNIRIIRTTDSTRISSDGFTVSSGMIRVSNSGYYEVSASFQLATVAGMGIATYIAYANGVGTDATVAGTEISKMVTSPIQHTSLCHSHAPKIVYIPASYYVGVYARSNGAVTGTSYAYDTGTYLTVRRVG